MAILKNPRHELFAQAIVQGKTGRAAYREGGHPNCQDNTADVNASKLLRNAKVSARIAELQDRQDASKRTVLTKAWVIEQTIALAKDARAAGAYGPAAKCLELLGREVYAFVERSEVGNPGAFDELSDADLRRNIARELGASRKNGSGIVESEGSESVQ